MWSSSNTITNFKHRLQSSVDESHRWCTWVIISKHITTSFTSRRIYLVIFFQENYFD
jgi:hypothetical protein